MAVVSGALSSSWNSYIMLIPMKQKLLSQHMIQVHKQVLLFFIEHSFILFDQIYLKTHCFHAFPL